jgi:hypothetical protein
LSREVRNEVEERRVIRLLAGAAEAIPPLQEPEVDAALARVVAAGASGHRARRSFVPRRPHLLSVAAVAAAAALVAVLPASLRESRPAGGSSPAGVDAYEVSFPEGSALSLLLSRPVERRA